MEDNDKRNSSVPSAPSASSEDGPSGPGSRRSEPDLFDAHEATLPRFTIDPSEAPRQRTRTLLGVPSLVSESEEPAPAVTPNATTLNELAEPPASGKGTPASFDAVAPKTLLDAQTEGLIDISVDVDDYLSDVTMVSDADVVALPDQTGQLQPVRIDTEPAVAAAVGQSAASSETGAAAYAATGPVPSSLAPREITRAAAKPQAPREPASGRGGALLVAAVMLLATGAWFLTAGTFRRATLSTASEAATAAATQPVTNMAAEKKVEPPLTATPAPAPSAAAKVAEAVSTPVPATTTSAQKSVPDDVASPGLKNKPALTASARGERVRRTGRAGKANATPAATGEVPQGPTRTEVVSRLETVRPAVQACAAGRSGVADLDVTIAHTGVVMHVLVGGDFAGTTEGSCIARAVRGARFPAFKQERFRLLYPYAI